MDWLQFAGAAQNVHSLSDRDKLVDFACNWLCLGRTRPALERLNQNTDALNTFEYFYTDRSARELDPGLAIVIASVCLPPPCGTN